MIEILLTCTTLAASLAITECTGGGFPYTVPPGHDLCISQMLLVNKYRENPPRYGTNRHTMYFAIDGMSVPAHHPEVTFVPPLRRPPGSTIQAKLLNGMKEAQRVYVHIGGYLVGSGDSCMLAR